MNQSADPHAGPPVTQLNPIEVADWDSQLADLPGATFFHTRAWATVLARTYGYRPCYLAQTHEGRLSALLPLIAVDSWLTGKRGVSLPFTDAVEPLCPNSAAFESLWAAALKQGEQQHWKYLELRGGKQWRAEAPASTRFFRHLLPLVGSEADLFKGCDEAVRRAIRKAERSNLSISIAHSADAMSQFYGLMQKTRRRHGVPPQPYSFFERIQEEVLAKNLGWIVLGSHGGVPVAGAIFFMFRDRAIYKFGASDEAHQNLRANNLVMWSAIKHCVGRGCASLDFGRTSLANEGLRKFKLSWGTREDEIQCVRYEFPGRRFVTAADEAHGWHNRVFSALPLPLARLAGEMLYRHIA